MSWLFVVKKRRPPESRPMIVDLWSANTKWARNPSAVSDAPIVEVRRRALCLGRVRYSGVNEAAFVRGGRYGISIDFGLEIIEKKEYLRCKLQFEIDRSNHGGYARIALS